MASFPAASWRSIFFLNIIDIHSMIIALIDNSNISLAWTDSEGSNTFRLSSQLKVSNWLHSDIIPDMYSWHFTTFSCNNNISCLSTSCIYSCNVILMVWESLDIFFCIFFLLNSTEKFLLSCCKILNNTKSCTCKNDFIVIFSKIKTSFISVSRKSINMINFIRTFWLSLVPSNVFRDFFIDLSKEMLILLELFEFCLLFLHLIFKLIDYIFWLISRL